MSNESNLFNFYVGFGGAGGKALAEFADHVSRDFDAGRKADSAYSFVLVDTSQDDLADSKSRIEKSLGRFCTNLMVKTIALGRPFSNNFVDDLCEKFDRVARSGDSTDLAKLKSTWWMISEDDPFAFAGVVSPPQGAGQMPLAARVMTWFNAEEIKETVQACVRDYRTRFNPDDNARIQMFIVTSLAGGTGRGCWASLSFMFREAFGDLGVGVNPMGLFLDAGCFDNCASIEAEYRPRLKLNALTGFSELRMFLKNAYRPKPGEKREKQIYTVPSLTNPKENIIDSRKGQAKSDSVFRLGDAGDPVDGALMIFKGNDYVSELSDEKKYYQLAGQTLFAAARYPEFRNFFVNNNDGKPIGAVASSVACVHAEKIMDYITVLKQARLAGRELELRTSGSPASRNLEPIFCFESKENELKKSAGRGAIRRKMEEAISNHPNLKNKLNDLANALKSQDLNTARDAAGNLAQRIPLADALAEWHHAICPNCEDDITRLAAGTAAYVADGILRHIFDQYFLKGDSKDRLTLKECIQALASLEQEWDESTQRTKTALSAGRTGGKDGNPLASSIEGVQQLIEKRAGKEDWFGLKGVRFSEKEQEEINAAARGAVKSINLPALEKELSACAPDVWRLLDEGQSLLSKILADLEGLSKGKDRELKNLKGCFVRLDEKSPANVRMLVHDVSFGTDARVSYELRPPMTGVLEEELNAKVEAELEDRDDPEKNRANAAQNRRANADIEAARSLVKDAVLDECHEKGKMANETSLLNAIRQRFGDSMDHLECSLGFIENYFSLEEILRQYVEACPVAYDAMKASERDRFRKDVLDVLGIDLESKNRPDAKDVKEVAANLAGYIAGNCHPFVLCSDKSRQSVTVYVPRIDGWTEADAKQLILASPAAKRFGLGKNANGEGRPTQVKLAESSPFSIMATSAVAFSNWDDDNSDLGIKSLNYWREGPGAEKVRAMLEAAEQPDLAKNIAVGARRDLTRNGGIGYVDPRFVFDKNWADLRWRPWWNASKRDREEQEQKSLGSKSVLLAYLCLGNFTPGKQGKTETTATELLAKVTAAKEWEMPLLARDPDPKSTGWSWTRKVYVDKDGSHERGTAKSSSWKTSTKISSLWKMVETFGNLTSEDIEAIKVEMAMFSAILASPEIDANQNQLKALRASVRTFLNGLIENEVETNYDDQKQKQDQMKDLLDSAANASDRLFPKST
jgi:Tubulin like